LSQTAFRIDRNASAQLWSQLRNALLSRIVTGAWSAGDQLPTELQLCQDLGISRSTVRAAIQSLVRDGLVVRTPGRGTFVTSAPAAQVKITPLGFYRTMTARGHSVRSDVLEVKLLPATSELALDLGLAEGAQILFIRRIRYLNEQPAALSADFLAYDLCRGLESEDLSSGSLWTKLEDLLGLQVAGGLHSFYAVMSTEEERRLLGLPKSSPLLLGRSINFLQDGTPFERAEVRVPGDRASLVVRYVTHLASEQERFVLPHSLA